ncbi:MAG: MFS transporter [Chloroflexi bacterium]|nr:MFS transporter [Chloroflexota bacterium]
MKAFLLVAVGQFVSLTGTAMSQFALSIWAWEETGQATALALVNVFGLVPLILLSPVAGALVDRWNRKLVMMLSDLGAGVATIAIFLLYSAGALEIWHLYVAAVITGAFQTFQWPAYSAAIAMMVPKEQYTRANALYGLAESASGILAPSLAAGLLAGVVIGTSTLLPGLGVGGILMIDIITFVAAIGALLVIVVPQPERSAAGEQAQGSLVNEAVYGFRYIFARPSLLGLQLVFMGGNFFASAAFTLLTPMLLSRTGNNEQILGLVQSVFGIGGVVGGLFLTAWGGPKRRVHGVLAGWILSSLGGMLLLGLGTGLLVWVIGAFVSSFLVPTINGSNQSIWQAKVPPDIQGKVFSARRMIAWLVNPLAALIVGPLADNALEPAMREGGTLTGAFGWLVGVGPGAGMALIIVLASLGATAIAFGAYFVPAVRNAEDILPDHDAQPAAPPVPVEVVAPVAQG